MKRTVFSTKKLFRWLNLPPILTFSLVFILFFVLCYLKLDPDFGWHLASGDYFFHHGVPATDIFTYTAAGFPWVDHEWFSDIIIYLMYLAGGYTLLALVYAILWTVSFYIMGRRVYGPLVILGVLAVLPFTGVRAVTWTVLGAVLVYMLVTTRQVRWRYILPLLFFAWANMHGGFIIGLALLLYWAIAQRSKQLAILVIASTLATLLTPYGVGVYVEIFRTVLDGGLRWVINEWLPIGYVWQTVGYVAVWAAGFFILRGKKLRSYLQVDVLLFLAAMSSIRHFPLFVVLSLPSTKQYVTHILTTIPRLVDQPRRNILWLITAVVVILALWGGYDMYAVPIDRESVYPVAAVDNLARHPCAGNIFNDYGAGGYLIWKLPNQKVYIDGRMPSWDNNGHKYMDDYFKVFTDKAFRDKQFTDYNIRCALIRGAKKSDIADDLKRDGWRSVVNANGYVLLEK